MIIPYRAVFTWLSKVIEELVWFWFYYALWLASVFTLVLVLQQSSENRSSHSQQSKGKISGRPSFFSPVKSKEIKIQMLL